MTATETSSLTPDELQAVWSEMRAPRSAVHRRHQVRACDTHLRMNGTRFGARPADALAPATGYSLSGGCPCRDLVADAIEIALAFLTDRDRLVNPPGAVRKHLKFRLVDLYRRSRHEIGAQVKPETVARNRYGRALPDDFHRMLYVMLVDEAGVRAPLRGQEGLLRRLTDRCAAECGGLPENSGRRLAAALRLIERTCRAGTRVNVGTPTQPELVTWWEAYIERPLGRRDDPSVHSTQRGTGTITGEGAVDVPDPVGARPFDHVLSVLTRAELPIGDGSDEDVVMRTLAAAVANAGTEEVDAELRRAIGLLGKHDLLPEARVRLLLRDPLRRREIIACLGEL